GGQGGDLLYTCLPVGMPRVLRGAGPLEFVVLPKITYLNYETNMPRRIYTDGRSFPTDEEPSFMGYSIGRWLDEDGDGRYDTLAVETRNFKGPRALENTGLPLHKDNQTVVKERISLDKNNPNLLYNEVTTIDNALTRPWTVMKNYRRLATKVLWYENNCTESNVHVVIGKENYYTSADGYLMPARKNQAPPDLRYFKQTQKGWEDKPCLTELRSVQLSLGKQFIVENQGALAAILAWCPRGRLRISLHCGIVRLSRL